MMLEVDIWRLIGFFLSFLGFVFGMAKLFFNQVEKRQAERFAGLESTLRGSEDNWSRLEREFLALKADLPLNYVRREDYIRGQTVIEAKLDALYNKLEVVQNRQIIGGKS